MVDILMAYGVNKDLGSAAGETARDLAVRHNHRVVVRRLAEP